MAGSLSPGRDAKPPAPDADICRVQDRVRVIRELVRDSLYHVEERDIADAILARAAVRRIVADPSFRGEQRGPVPIIEVVANLQVVDL